MNAGLVKTRYAILAYLLPNLVHHKRRRRERHQQNYAALVTRTEARKRDKFVGVMWTVRQRTTHCFLKTY